MLQKSQYHMRLAHCLHLTWQHRLLRRCSLPTWFQLVCNTGAKPARLTKLTLTQTVLSCSLRACQRLEQHCRLKLRLKACRLVSQVCRALVAVQSLECSVHALLTLLDSDMETLYGADSFDSFPSAIKFPGIYFTLCLVPVVWFPEPCLLCCI